MKHFIAMAGLHGYLPNTCDVYDTYSAACESMIQLHDLQWKRVDPETHHFLPGAKTLRQNGYLELNLDVDGNEYCEVTECDCDEPWIHSDSTSETEWKREHETDEEGQGD